MLDYRLMFAPDVHFGSKADIACAALADNAHNNEIRDNVAKRMRRQPTPFRQRIPVGLGTVRSATKAMQTHVFISSEPERGWLVEDRNIVVDYRYSQGEPSRRKAAIIVTAGGAQASLAAKSAGLPCARPRQSLRHPRDPLMATDLYDFPMSIAD